MAQGGGQKAVILELQSELTCSICTEVLYQPLTLLDCLHTFCGSCLKEWFSWQDRDAHSSQDYGLFSSRTRFTCPACRAAVRDTKHDAKVNTLLDMLLSLDPSKEKSEEEKKDISEKYEAGDQVLPQRRGFASERLGTTEDIGIGLLASQIGLLNIDDSQTSSTSPANRQTRASGRRRDRNSERHGFGGQRSRDMEHQISLRSLISNPDESLSDEISGTYRRRHSTQAQLWEAGRQQPMLDERQSVWDSQSRQRRESRSRGTQRNRTTPFEAPPLSGIWGLSEPSRLRSASRPRRPSPVASSRSLPTSSHISRPGSAFNHSGSRPTSSQHSIASRTSRQRETWSRPSTRERSTERGHAASPAISRSPRDPSPAVSPQIRVTTPVNPNTSMNGNQAPALSPEHTGRDDRRVDMSSVRSSTPARVSSATVASRSVTPISLWPEPNITCKSCGKAQIQYELHKVCEICDDGRYHLCLQCYRERAGCSHWFGFGMAGQANYERHMGRHPVTSSTAAPHVLISQRYLHPPEGGVNSDGMTSHNPSLRRQEGMFCDMCHAFADTCFWKCDQCNDGEWGFCSDCVNQGSCCTHHLLPITRVDRPENRGEDDVGPIITFNTQHHYKPLRISSQCNICSSDIQASATRYHCQQCENGDYDICVNCYLRLHATGRISKEDGLEGWRRCPSGHRMIIVAYQRCSLGFRRVEKQGLVGGQTLKDMYPFTGTHQMPVRRSSGRWTWRNLSSSSNLGRRRRANRPRAGADIPPEHSSADTDLLSLEDRLARGFPPSGGDGLRVLAQWSYYPKPDVDDEIFFPRGAEITEALNINNDWFWGCYAGQKGLFPGHEYIKILGDGDH